MKCYTIAKVFLQFILTIHILMPIHPIIYALYQSRPVLGQHHPSLSHASGVAKIQWQERACDVYEQP